MITYMSAAGLSPFSLNDLSSELLALIFEQLRDLDYAGLIKMRLVNRRFSAIILPIQYREIHLNERLISTITHGRAPILLRNICSHTQYVVAESNLSASGIKNVLQKIRRLKGVKWIYTRSSLSQDAVFLPSDVLSLTPQIRLEVEGLPLRDFTDSYSPDTYIRAIPPSMLTSLKMATPVPPITSRLGSLKDLLIASSKLETFHYIDRGQGTHFKFEPGERMPAFKNLSMKCYDWNHEQADVNRHWNFTQLESLELHYVPLYPFLSSVNFNMFHNMRELRLDDYSAHLADQRGEATVLLHKLVRDHLRDLRVLCITVHTRLFPLDAITMHAKTLEELRFRDHVGFGEDDCRCPTLWADDVIILSEALVNIRRLELDMDTALCEPVDFLRALCKFRKLNNLTLHVQTILHPLEQVHPNMDRDLEASLRTFGFLRDIRNEMLGSSSLESHHELHNNHGLCGLVTGFSRIDTNMGSPSPPPLSTPEIDLFSNTGIAISGPKRRKTPDLWRDKCRTPPTRKHTPTPTMATVPWQSVTLNVGGWKKVMVRRLGDAWRQRNENGVFAERCFVMERSRSGDLYVREEKCIEAGDASSPSNPGTP